MPRSVNSPRRPRTFHLESLERRELMSATPWADGAIALHATASYAPSATQTATDLRLITASASSLTAASPTPGSLDASFGSGGKVRTHVNSTDWAEAVAVQVDGKIVAVGVSNNDFVIARCLSTGKLDTTFGNGGTVRVNFSGIDQAADIAIQPDGKILVVGTMNVNGSSDFALLRLTSSGKLDTAFGVGGKVTTNISGVDRAEAIAIQSDGKIVVAGTASDDFAAVRYHANGSLDMSFGAGGKTRVNFSGVDNARDVVIQADGKIVVVGGVSTDTNIGIMRLTKSGQLDTTFGSGGKVVANTSGKNWAEAVAVQRDGKILVAGTTSDDFSVTRFQANGQIDTSFGSSGTTRINFSGVDKARDLVVQADGKIVVVGGISSDNDIGVARLTAAGKLDSTFGSNGKVVTNVSGADRAHGVALQRDGKIVVVGSSSNDICLLRYHGAGSTPLASAAAVNRQLLSADAVFADKAINWRFDVSHALNAILK